MKWKPNFISKQYILLYFIFLLFTGCATIGRQTLYKNSSIGEINKVGFARIEGDTIVAKVYPQTDSIFKATVLGELSKYSTKSVYPINKELSVSQPDTAAIREACRVNNLDGLLLSRIKFINITYTTLYILPVGKNYDTDVEMKLFDKEANLLLDVRYKTLSNNLYLEPPTADKSIRNGTQGAIKRLMKEHGWTQ